MDACFPAIFDHDVAIDRARIKMPFERPRAVILHRAKQRRIPIRIRDAPRVSSTPDIRRSAVSRNGESSVAITGVIRNDGSVPRMLAPAFSAADHVLKAVGVLSKIVQSARQFYGGSKRRVIGTRSMRQFTGYGRDVFKMFGQALPFRRRVFGRTAIRVGMRPVSQLSCPRSLRVKSLPHTASFNLIASFGACARSCFVPR